MPPLVLTRHGTGLTTWDAVQVHYVLPYPHHAEPRAGDSTVAELFVLHPIVNLCLEERLEVVANDIPIC